MAVRVGVPAGAAESVAAGTEPVGGLAGGVDGGAGALASGSCGVRGVRGMKTGADLRETDEGGGVVVRRSEAVGERVGPVGGFAAAGGVVFPVSANGALASACVLPKAGGSGPVEGRDVVAGAGSGVVGALEAADCCGRMEVGGRAGGIWICEVGDFMVPPGGVIEPVAGRVDMPETGGSGSVVGREPCAGVRVGALEKTGGWTLPEGDGVTGGSARVGGRGGAGWVVRCSWTVGGREKLTGGLGPVKPGVTLAGGRIAPGDDWKPPLGVGGLTEPEADGPTVSRIDPVAGRFAGRAGAADEVGNCTEPLGLGSEPVRGKSVMRGTELVVAVEGNFGGDPSGRCEGGGASSAMRKGALRAGRSRRWEPAASGRRRRARAGPRCP